MRSFTTRGIILNKTDFGEADKIIIFLTPDYGKVKTIAKSVRKSRSRLAGGIELFSESELTLVQGRGKLDTLISTRLIKHFGNIVKDIQVTQYAYDFIIMIDKSTEDSPESFYYQLLKKGLNALNTSDLGPDLVKIWFEMQLLKLTGHQPDLKTDFSGTALEVAEAYGFNLDKMKFSSKKTDYGRYTSNDIKFLRLGFSASRPEILSRIEGVNKMVMSLQPLVQAMLKQFVRI
jgi:DNA repair protein RecO (recombination protein O)